MTCNSTDTRHGLHFKRGQGDCLSGGHWPLNNGRIKDIFGSLPKCQLVCCNSTYICISPSFTTFIKVLFIHHVHYLPDSLSTYLDWYFIGILTIQDDQHQYCPLVLGKLWDPQINSTYPKYGTVNPSTQITSFKS